MKIPTREFLEQRRIAVLADLRLKVEADDWHGVADAAMDLREIDAQLIVIGPPAEYARALKYDQAVRDIQAGWEPILNSEGLWTRNETRSGG